MCGHYDVEYVVVQVNILFYNPIVLNIAGQIMEQQQRMMRLSDGKRMPVRMEVSSWNAVDWLADRDFIQWDDWCRRAIEARGGGNATASIRAAIIEGLLWENVAQERAEACGVPVATGFSLAGVCWDRNDFDYAVSQAISLEGRQDLGVVEVISGIDEFGRVCFYIRNKMEGCPSMTISVPLKPEKWLDIMEGRK